MTYNTRVRFWEQGGDWPLREVRMPEPPRLGERLVMKRRRDDPSSATRFKVVDIEWLIGDVVTESLVTVWLRELQ